MVSQETKVKIKESLQESYFAALYELIGTMLLTILLGNYYMIQNYNQEIEGNPTLLTSFKKADSAKTGLIVGMFCITMFAARISGSHFNPCISLAYMIREMRTSFKPLLCLIYIIAQFAGAIMGAGIVFLFKAGSDSHFGIEAGGDRSNPLSINLEPMSGFFIHQAILEILGAFILTFMYLTSTVSSTKFTDDAALQTIILSASYYCSMHFAGIYIEPLKCSPVNPAIAWAFWIWNVRDNTKGFAIFTFCPLIGALLSYIFFNLVYLRTK